MGCAPVVKKGVKHGKTKSGRWRSIFEPVSCIGVGVPNSIVRVGLVPRNMVCDEW